MDDDHQDEIYDYFCDSESDSLDEATKELGSDYTEEEDSSCTDKAYIRTWKLTKDT